MSETEELSHLSASLGEVLLARGWRASVAESCTGGWLAKVITDTAGSSAWFDQGFVTYSDAAKAAMLGVDARLLERRGAVSEEAAVAMAEGALARSEADLVAAITGIAGPGGGSADKPVGLVWLAWQRRGDEGRARAVHFDGGREAVRRQAVQAALWGLIGLARD